MRWHTWVRYLELRYLILVLILVLTAFCLAQAGLDHEDGLTFSWERAGWWNVFFWYGLVAIGISLLLALFLGRADQVIFPLMILLGGLSLMLMYRLPTPVGYDMETGSLISQPRNMWYLGRQMQWLAVGMATMLVVLFWPRLLDWLRDHSHIIIVSGLSLLLATAIFGKAVVAGGPRVELDLGPLHFQPAELIKLLFVIYLAGYLHKVRPDFNRFTYRYLGLPLPIVNYLIPMGLVLLGAILFLFWMSDLGPALILIGVFPVMIFVALHARIFRSLVLIFCLSLVLIAFLLNTVQHYMGSDVGVWLQEPKRITVLPQVATGRVAQGISRVSVRIDNWRDPWSACPSSDDCPSYQTLQTVYSLAAGGVLGAGLGQGYLHYIPAIFTDLVFVAIGEEWGLLGAGAVLGIYWLLLARSATIARRQPESFRSLLAVGLVSIFSLQIMVIIGGTLNIIPLTGITVPFLSYGGTSIVVNSVMLGLLLRLSILPEQIAVTGETRSNIRNLMRFYKTGFFLLLLGLIYSTVWMNLKLYPSFPDDDARSANPVARQRQAAWLERVERGQILAADGRIIVRNSPSGRVNDYPSLVHVIGRTRQPGLGLSGLEGAYNNVLLGQGRYDPATLWARYSGGTWQGNGLKLTIDLNWQEAANASLGEWDGAVVVIDAGSGAVLAMVSHPLYDPATNVSGVETAPELNRAIDGLYPPGSTFKTVIGALSLERDLVAPETVFDFSNDLWFWSGERLCHQRWMGGGEIVSCNSDLLRMSFTEGYIWSDNILFAELATALGPRQVWDGAAGFAFGQDIPFDLPVERSHVASTQELLADPAQLALTGFGQAEVLATPLQMALIAAAIANGGQIPRPYLVSEILRPDQTMLDQVGPQVWQRAISPATAQMMAEVMIKSVQSGWANSAGVDGLVVGGKTGTAEWAGTPNGALPHSWFIGFAHMPGEQRVALAVIVEAAGEGSQWAAPIASQIIGQMAPIMVSQ